MLQHLQNKYWARTGRLASTHAVQRLYCSAAANERALFGNQLSNLQRAALAATESQSAAEIHTEIASRFAEKRGPRKLLSHPPKQLLLALSLKASTPEEAELLLDAHDKYVSHQYPMAQSTSQPALLKALIRARHWDAVLKTLENRGRRQIFLTKADVLGHAARGIAADKDWEKLRVFARLLPKALNPEVPAPSGLLIFTIRKLALGAPDLALSALREAVAAGVPLKPNVFQAVMTPLLAQGKIDDAIAVLKLARTAAQTPIAHGGSAAAHPGAVICRPPASAGLVQLAIRAAAAARAAVADADVAPAVEVIWSATAEQRQAGKAKALEFNSLVWDDGAGGLAPSEERLAEEAWPAEVVEALQS
jgi:hypothetical protein